jgi:putative spermidine/putrescine transport system permease protein
VSRRAEPATLGRGWFRWVLAAVVCCYFALPVIATLLYSLASSWGADPLPDGLTLRWWQETLSDERLLAAVVRSLVLALLTVLACNLLVVPALYWSAVRNPHLRAALAACALVPFSLPFVVTAIGLKSVAGLTEWTAAWEASRELVLLGHIALTFPFLLWAVDAAIQSVRVRDLVEAAAVLGAGPWRTLWSVVLPNIRTGIVTGSVLVFATSVAEISIVSIVTGAAFETVPMWQINELSEGSGRTNGVAVITIALFTLLFACSALLARAGAPRFSAVRRTAPPPLSEVR